MEDVKDSEMYEEIICDVIYAADTYDKCAQDKIEFLLCKYKEAVIDEYLESKKSETENVL